MNERLEKIVEQSKLLGTPVAPEWKDNFTGTGYEVVKGLCEYISELEKRLETLESTVDFIDRDLYPNPEEE